MYILEPSDVNEKFALEEDWEAQSEEEEEW